MLDVISIREILAIASNFGISGLVLVLWWVGDRRAQQQRQDADRVLQEQRQADAKSIQSVLDQYKDHFQAQLRQYENNVELVKAFRDLHESHQDLTIMTATGLSKLSEEVRTNQFCPVVRQKA